MMFQKLLELKQSGLLKHMVVVGFVSPKVYTYLEIYMWVDAKQRTTDLTLEEIVADAGYQFRKSRSTIWRAIRAVRGIG